MPFQILPFMQCVMQLFVNVKGLHSLHQSAKQINVSPKDRIDSRSAETSHQQLSLQSIMFNPTSEFRQHNIIRSSMKSRYAF